MQSLSNSVKIAHFLQKEKTVFKCIWSHKRPEIVKTILRKNKARGITIPNFKLYYKTVLIGLVLAQKQIRGLTEQNGEPRNKHMPVWSIIHHKGDKIVPLSLWQTVLEKLDMHVQKNETGPFITPCTKVNSEWIKDLNLRPKTGKVLPKNLGG